MPGRLVGRGWRVTFIDGRWREDELAQSLWGPPSDRTNSSQPVPFSIMFQYMNGSP